MSWRYVDLDVPIRGAQFAQDRITPIRGDLKSHDLKRNPKFRSIRCDVFTLFSDVYWAAAEGGGAKRIRVNLGGGEIVLQSVLSKTTFGGLRNWGWSGRCLFLLREMTGSRQKRGGKRIVGGGSENVFGEGFFAEFTVCFPPP